MQNFLELSKFLNSNEKFKTLFFANVQLCERPNRKQFTCRWLKAERAETAEKSGEECRVRNMMRNVNSPVVNSLVVWVFHRWAGSRIDCCLIQRETRSNASADGLMIQLIAIDHDPPTMMCTMMLRIWRFFHFLSPVNSCFLCSFSASGASYDKVLVASFCPVLTGSYWPIQPVALLPSIHFVLDDSRLVSSFSWALAVPLKFSFFEVVFSRFGPIDWLGDSDRFQ